MKLHFFLRRHKANPAFASICFHITVNQRRTKSPLSTKIQIAVADWNKKSRTIRNSPELTNRLRLIESKLNKIYNTFLASEKPFSAESVKKAYRSENKKMLTFLEYFEEYLKKRRSLSRTDVLDIETYKIDVRRYNKVKEYLRSVT